MADYTIGMKRANVYESMQAIQYEACGNSNCHLYSIAPTIPPLIRTCSLGRLSAYHVAVQTADQISKTLKFVGKHNIRVSIKNTGHDYLGRSVSPNSLALWTHNLKDMRYHPTFEAKQCSKVQVKHVGEIGAGFVAVDAYHFFENYNMNVPGGNAASIGLAGSLGQNGGHGVFTLTLANSLSPL